MSIRFAIKNTAGKAEKEGDSFIRFSGTGEPFRRHCERAVRKIGVDGGGNPKLTFTTGMDEKQVQFYSWYNDEEKKIISLNLWAKMFAAYSSVVLLENSKNVEI